MSSAEAQSTTAAHIDSGASVSVLDVGFDHEHAELFEPLPSAIGIDAAGNRAEASMARKAGCEIGNRHFTAPLAITVWIRGIQRAP